MNSREACWFASEIGADLTIPLHYDMIGGNEENPLVFADYMERYYPEKKYHISGWERGISCNYCQNERSGKTQKGKDI